MNDGEYLKKQLKQDIEWMWDEGFYSVANRLMRLLRYIEELEKNDSRVTAHQP
jgi:hypothetical protein